MATLTAIQGSLRLHAFRCRLRAAGCAAAGKPPKLTLTASMRKLLVLANALCQHQTTWDPTMA